MSTYAPETASNLAASLDSLTRQSILPDQLVLVIDGAIDSDQEEVIAAFVESASIPTTLVRLPFNRGLAEAMNAGINRCIGDFVMRMDSDDICERDRVECQLAYAANHTDIDVISSWTEEFFEDGAPPQLKVSPTNHDAVVRALRWRNVLVHPTIMIKRKALLAVHGYRRKYGLLEDYDLFVRLALSGAKFHVIPKVLVRSRSSTAQRRRRGGFGYLINEVKFRVGMPAHRLPDKRPVRRRHADVFRFPPRIGIGQAPALRPRADLTRTTSERNLSRSRQIRGCDERPTPHSLLEDRLSVERESGHDMNRLQRRNASSRAHTVRRFLGGFFLVLLCVGIAWPLLPRRYELTAR